MRWEMIRTGVLILIGLLLTGCDSQRVMTKKISSVKVSNIRSVESVVSDKLNDIEKMERCRRELEALKRVDIKLYNQRKAEFDRLMRGADIYSGVRSDVRISTQDAVDAYYRYRVDKMCADISKNVLDSLSDSK
ncbi:hypothetical protein KJE04_05775 [Escherichia marmotae]|nr:hypothetical protein [Escherichia marmotae]HAH3395504.1 hypothetical protein [Escherichia coli]MDQ9266137.1 hypothetical protein [Escherichia marmotae]MDQ9273018.1 hypothetical protein [Escherichia marmotae]MDQ9310923.1 hypothetical protein [Escherichia marmotae]